MKPDKNLDGIEKHLKKAVRLTVSPDLDEKVNRLFRIAREEEVSQGGQRIPLWGGITVGILAFVGGMVLERIDFKLDPKVTDQTAVMEVSGAVPADDSAVVSPGTHRFAKQFFLTPREELVLTYPEAGENNGV